MATRQGAWRCKTTFLPLPFAEKEVLGLTRRPAKSFSMQILIRKVETFPNVLTFLSKCSFRALVALLRLLSTHQVHFSHLLQLVQHSSFYIFPILNKQQLQVISSPAHLAALIIGSQSARKLSSRTIRRKVGWKKEREKNFLNVLWGSIQNNFVWHNYLS